MSQSSFSRPISANPSVSASVRPIALRSDDSNSPLPRKLEVVSKQATKVTALSTKLEWKIEQFEKLMKLVKNGSNLISRQFSVPQAPTVCWELHVYPNGKREEDVNNVSFFLRQVGLQRGEEPIMTEFQIYALDANSQRISVCRDTKDFTNQQGRGKFQVSREKMMGALRADGTLFLICEVEYFPPGSKISVEPVNDDDPFIEDIDEKIEMNIRESNREMWENELFTDCVIKVTSKYDILYRKKMEDVQIIDNSKISDYKNDDITYFISLVETEETLWLNNETGYCRNEKTTPIWIKIEECCSKFIRADPYKNGRNAASLWQKLFIEWKRIRLNNANLKYGSGVSDMKTFPFEAQMRFLEVNEQKREVGGQCITGPKDEQPVLTEGEKPQQDIELVNECLNNSTEKLLPFLAPTNQHSSEMNEIAEVFATITKDWSRLETLNFKSGIISYMYNSAKRVVDHNQPSTSISSFDNSI